MRIAAVILAAGRSSRAAPVHKLLYPIGGQPLIRRAVGAALASAAEPIIVVVGHDALVMQEVLSGLPINIVENPKYAEGLSSSLRVGLSAVPSSADGALILLGDMPRVGATHLDALIAVFDPGAGRSVCVPTWQGQRGNPVLWSAAYFPALCGLQGDVGGREILARHAPYVHTVPMADDAVLFDIDERETLIAFSSRI